MTEQNDQQSEKKKLGLARPGRLELRKTVDAGQVRQSFSHGRSKAVTVEVRRKRTFAQTADGTLTEVTKAEQEAMEAAEAEAQAAAAAEAAAPEGAEVEVKPVPRTLTEGERAARARALLGAKEAELDAAAAAEEAARLAAERDEERRLAREEEERRRSDLDARRREDEERLQQEEERKKAEIEAAGKAPDVAASAVPAPEAAADADSPAAKKGKLKLGARMGPEAAEADDGPRARRGRTEVKRPAVRRTEPRRRAGKILLTQALDEEERVRSLASVRRARERERRLQMLGSDGDSKVVREVVIPETITVQDLANRMAERGTDVVKTLMKLGVMATITQTIDADTAELVTNELGHKVKRVSESDVELGLRGEEDEDELLAPRPPVVTVMGHVDHGKTSLLDALRQADVVAGEAGGITQHIGAYQAQLSSGERITFLDTPGHEAFTAMRARGANATDIVVLVVAADDGIMPQTVEAIHHAKAAKVPIIVAINKMDKPEANPDRVRNELLQHELVVEQLGGDILNIEVSALKKTNLDKLEEAILLQAEVLELKANPNRPADGVVVEAQLDRGRGPVATLLVQRGTLKIGDIVVAGGEWGRVRALVSDTGKQIDSAGPSTPVEVLGLNGTPSAGDEFAVVESETRAREISEYRQRQARLARTAVVKRGTLEEMFTQLESGTTGELPVLIKADVQGSVEAIAASAKKLSTDEVSIRFLHTGVGAINESDVTLAKASNGLIIGFNVRANRQARDLAEQDGVDIRYYSIIYNVIDDLRAMLSGLLAPMKREKFLGNAAILEVFNITKAGKVAGCRVTDGIVKRGASVRLLRDDVVIHEGTLSTLKRFKDEVREVREGFECGMAFENYQDIKAGDVIECFEFEEVARTL